MGFGCSERNKSCNGFVNVLKSYSFRDINEGNSSMVFIEVYGSNTSSTGVNYLISKDNRFFLGCSIDCLLEMHEWAFIKSEEYHRERSDFISAHIM